MSLNKGWTNTIDAGLTDPSARKYDTTVSSFVNEYNARLEKTPDYVLADYKLIRAMMWVESGGPKGSQWNGRVMQIGNNGDPGYDALRNHEGAVPLVVAPATLKRLAEAKPGDINDPFFNIEVGIAYVWTRLCKTDVGTIVDDATDRTHTVAPKGEIASRLAHSEGTTLQDLQQSNPGVNLNALKGGSVLHFHKSHNGRRIKSWMAFTAENIARTYNVGDPAYADKLRYVMSVINW
ncbi:MAG: hypothetical protein U0441_08365 [Polyangiaceae bacterium]